MKLWKLMWMGNRHWVVKYLNYWNENGLSNLEVDHFARFYLQCPNYRGTWAKDSPRLIRLLNDSSPFSCIVNLDTMDGPGFHFVTLSRPNKDSPVFYWDSLALPCPWNNFHSVFSYPIQNPQSSWCGIYALLFLCLASPQFPSVPPFLPLTDDNLVFNLSSLLLTKKSVCTI